MHKIKPSSQLSQVSSSPQPGDCLEDQQLLANSVKKPLSAYLQFAQTVRITPTYSLFD